MAVSNAVETIKNALGSVIIEPKQDLIHGHVTQDTTIETKKTYTLTYCVIDDEGMAIPQPSVHPDLEGYIVKTLTFGFEIDEINKDVYVPEIVYQDYDQQLLVVPSTTIYSDIAKLIGKATNRLIQSTPENIGSELKMCFIDSQGVLTITSLSFTGIDVSLLASNDLPRAVSGGVPFAARDMCKKIGATQPCMLIMCVNPNKVKMEI